MLSIDLWLQLQSSDEDFPIEEEAEVLKIQREKAKSLLMEDFGLENYEQDNTNYDKQNKTFQVRFTSFALVLIFFCSYLITRIVWIFQSESSKISNLLPFS